MPVAFSTADVERVAALARLALTAEEKDLFARQLGDVLRYADEVRGLDTSGVPPTAQALADPPPLREDDPRPSLPRGEALGAAPDADPDAGLFKVPRVIG